MWDTRQTNSGQIRLARFVRVRGIVQGVGFRPFLFRLAQAHGVKGWVLNAGDGVRIHVEGTDEAVGAFLRELETAPPPAASVASLEVSAAVVLGFADFEIHESEDGAPPTARISPDLPVCPACLEELGDADGRRYGYPYINCTDCGPRFSIILGLPYDRPRTTMKDWPLCAACAGEYHDPLDRRFHAQPVACPDCGPHYVLTASELEVVARPNLQSRRASARGSGAAARDEAAIREAARMLRAGQIVAVKGIGGYHLACDAWQSDAVLALRERKYRKEKPFALMARDLDLARRLIHLTPEAEALLTSPARPIVLAPARLEVPHVAPENRELGVMLPYTALHHLLFAAGAPEVLVMTSANRSSEPIAYRDADAFRRLSGIADAFLAGERPIARRVEDSVARAGALGTVVLRRGRGWAPGAVARLPIQQPVLAVGADLKNSVTLVVGGEAFVSQHIGDLEDYQAYQAFQEAIRDLTSIYEVDWGELLVIHDLHPQYASTGYAVTLPAREIRAVQHHRAHIASVLAERGAFEKRVLGVAFDGTGCGDDGTIWGGEFFVGSLVEGFARVAHLRAAVLPGGDAAARYPVQAAAGFLAELDGTGDLAAPPFGLGRRYLRARELVDRGVRTFPTTSAGRLFDTAAALLGFTREVIFEGQAAVWLEHLARGAAPAECDAARFSGDELDFRPTLEAMIDQRRWGRGSAEIARGFHRGLARGVADGVLALCEAHGLDTAVVSGGVFQNELLLGDLAGFLEPARIRLWTNREVPPNDGGISLGQAALALSAHEVSG